MKKSVASGLFRISCWLSRANLSIIWEKIYLVEILKFYQPLSIENSILQKDLYSVLPHSISNYFHYHFRYCLHHHHMSNLNIGGSISELLPSIPLLSNEFFYLFHQTSSSIYFIMNFIIGQCFHCCFSY